MLFNEWVDFVVYPLDSNKVLNREQRLDTSKAIYVTDLDYTPEIGTEKGTIFTKDQIIFDFEDDEFETMWVSETGKIVIWTKKRVWTLYCRIDGMERMIYLPRNPDLSQLF